MAVLKSVISQKKVVYLERIGKGDDGVVVVFVKDVIISDKQEETKLRQSLDNESSSQIDKLLSRGGTT